MTHHWSALCWQREHSVVGTGGKQGSVCIVTLLECQCSVGVHECIYIMLVRRQPHIQAAIAQHERPPSAALPVYLHGSAGWHPSYAAGLYIISYIIDSPTTQHMLTRTRHLADNASCTTVPKGGYITVTMPIYYRLLFGGASGLHRLACSGGQPAGPRSIATMRSLVRVHALHCRMPQFLKSTKAGAAQGRTPSGTRLAGTHGHRTRSVTFLAVAASDWCGATLR